jgi:hypothetical protein
VSRPCIVPYDTHGLDLAFGMLVGSLEETGQRLFGAGVSFGLG